MTASDQGGTQDLATGQRVPRLRSGKEMSPCPTAVPNVPDSWPFGNLVPFRYNFIMADPPWKFKLRSAKGEKKSPQHHYGCMSLDDIKRLPVAHLAAPDCVLFLWATSPMLRQGFEVLDAWGFKFASQGQWIKRTPSGKLCFGTGYRLRSASEPFLIATIGRPKTSRAHRNVIDGLRREHSRKPEESFQWAETYMPNATRLELFSRNHRPGWECFGDEAGKFDEPADIEDQADVACAAPSFLGDAGLVGPRSAVV
jgi:N6-adenosine-specific RNA methylase IME4